jgi:3-methylcrotonyl-CoA carboxylase alpha subunit
MEARLYAEDPAKGFLPSTGQLDVLYFPDDIRVETGVAEGDPISPYYDPMIAKLVSSAADREGARRKLSKACGEFACASVKSNAWFLKRLLEAEPFAIGKVGTGFIADHEAELTSRHLPSDRSLSEVLGWDLRLSADNDPRVAGLARFRLNAAPRLRQTMNVDGHAHEFDFTPTPTGEYYEDGFRELPHSDAKLLSIEGDNFLVTWPRTEASSGSSVADGAILSPMPGKVIAVDVAEGEAVSKGQRLLVLEAMKMEHALTAPFDGTVAALNVAEGQQVQVEAMLARVAKDAS